MIIQCPACAGRFSAEQQRFAGKRVTIRCARCRHLFRVSGVPTPSPKILLAHTDSNLCHRVSELFSGSKFALRFIHDGAQTLQQLVSWKPEVLLLDVALPGFWPFEIPEKIHNNPLLSQTKVILLASVFNKAAYRRQPAQLYGADDCIDEHLLNQDLVKKVEEVLKKPKASR